MFEKQIYKTGDGSHTLFVPAMNEFYHSSNGAYTESMHVFIQLGFNEVVKKHDSINILEVGFGTGLNCLLTIIEAKKQDLIISYDALEPYPLNPDLVNQLKYCELPELADADGLLKYMHQAESDKWITISNHFLLRKQIQKIDDVCLPPESFDLVYYDAFGPKAQPEMWAITNLQKTYSSMKEGGILVTYCAKGQVRRDMQSVGFDVERLPGPPGKREVLRAKKC